MKVFLPLILLLLTSLSVPAQDYEMRGVWIATVFNIDWPRHSGTSQTIIDEQKRSLDQLLDDVTARNFNTVCLQVRSMGDAAYTSTLDEPFSEFISGQRGKDGGWDPLRYAIEQAHKRGLALYAWINPFRQSKGKFYDAPSDRRARQDSTLLSWGEYTVYNPGLPQVREHVAQVVEDIIMHYRVDGIIFDDYFYPNKLPEDERAGDYTLWKSSGSNQCLGDWRRGNINQTISKVYERIKNLRPDVRFGISPAGVACKDDTSAPKYGLKGVPVKAADWQWREIYSDPVAWLKEGTIDFISPQIYWVTSHSTAPYEPLAKWWAETADHFGRHLYSSHSLSNYGKKLFPSKEELRTQTQINRDNAPVGATGSIFYSAVNLSRLPKDLYTNKALIPTVKWKKGRKLPHITQIKLRDDILTWKPISIHAAGKDRHSADEIMKYAVFEVIDGKEVLLGVSYESSFKLASPKAKESYRVKALDGYGYLGD